MKTYRPLFRLLLVGSVLGWLSAGCRNGTEDGTDPQAHCRLQRVVSTTKTLSGSGTDETTYGYDAAGNLVKKIVASAFTNTTGGGTNATTTETYTYTEDGFLADYTYATNQKAVSFTGAVTNYQYAQHKTFMYTSNRLTGYTLTTTAQNGGAPVPTTTTHTYVYDAAGQLVTETGSGGPNGPTAVWTYQNGQLVDYVEKGVTTESRPYTVQDGLITKARFVGTISYGNGPTGPYVLDQVYQYDDQRRLIKQQEFVNDTLDRYYTQEWQTGKPATLCLPAFKGHPVVKALYGEPGVLVKNRQYFVNKQRGNAVYQYMENTYTNQLNAQGYVTSTKLESVPLMTGQTVPDVTTTVYTYTGCN